jgi:hypothetical protein
VPRPGASSASAPGLALLSSTPQRGAFSHSLPLRPPGVLRFGGMLWVPDPGLGGGTSLSRIRHLPTALPNGRPSKHRDLPWPNGLTRVYSCDGHVEGS